MTLQNIKDKKEILKSDRDKNNITFKVVTIRVAAKSSIKLVQARNKRITFLTAEKENTNLKFYMQ